jgi:hypothetical protein
MRGPERGLATDDGRRAVKLRICLIAIACAAATAALGMGSARAATINSYCIDGATVSVANDTPLGTLNQFQLDTYASLGGAYTFKIGTGADASTTPPADSGSTTTTTTAAASPVAETPGGIFLCYSQYQVDPGVWSSSQAQELLAGGYWKPVAVAGLQSSTRYGAFSLVCNPGKEAASAPVAAVDGSGDIYTDPSYLGRIDTYAIIG